MTIIPDGNFPTPEEINQQPCVTADRYLTAVENTVNILQVCQDSYNTSLLVFDISLTGPFFFTPTLRILSVDGDDSYGQNNATALFALGHYKNPDLPINTNCQTWFGQLVFDVGSVISNYITASTIEFELVMNSSLPQAFGVTFPTQAATTTYLWTKTVIPTPISLFYTNGDLQVAFEYIGELECSCDLTCSTSSGISQEVSFCKDEVQLVTFYQDPNSTDPYTILLELEDNLGNTATSSFQSVFGVTPMPPAVFKAEKPYRIDVNIVKASAANVLVDDEVYYQVLKYENNKSNFTIWKDWSNKNWSKFVDYDITAGQKYGYAVKFKGKLGDESNISDWTEITA